MQSFKVDHYNPTVYHLTLSVLLRHYPDIKKHLIGIQNELTKGLDFTEDISNAGLYKYPADTLHFSLINFATATMVNENQRDEFQRKYQALINKLRDEIELSLDKFKSWELCVSKLHFVKKPHGPTISVSVVLNNGFENDLKEELDGLIGLSLAEAKILKFYPSGNNFAINLIRIFRELSEAEERQLIEQFEQCNKGLTSSKLEISKLSLVVSDNYLSNLDPEIVPFTVK